MSDSLRGIRSPHKARKSPVAPGRARSRNAVWGHAEGWNRRWPADVLRHSFACYHLAHHKDATALALEMGHSSPKTMFAQYRELVKPADAAELWSLTAGRKAPAGK